MKKLAALVLFVLVDVNISIAETKQVYCPFVANLSTGEVVRSKNNYRCFAKLKDAKKAGFHDGTSAPSQGDIQFDGSTPTKTATFVISHVPAVVLYSHEGNGNFAIVTYISPDDYQDLLINKIGTYSGESRIYKKGTYYLDISNTSGSYHITISQ